MRLPIKAQISAEQLWNISFWSCLPSRKPSHNLFAYPRDKHTQRGPQRALAVM